MNILQRDYALVFTPELAKAIILSSEPEREEETNMSDRPITTYRVKIVVKSRL